LDRATPTKNRNAEEKTISEMTDQSVQNRSTHT